MLFWALSTEDERYPMCSHQMSLNFFRPMQQSTCAKAALTLTLTAMIIQLGLPTLEGYIHHRKVGSHTEQRQDQDHIGDDDHQSISGDGAIDHSLNVSLAGINIAVIVVPGIQGTLLYRCSRKMKPRTCTPLFLSPLMSERVSNVYQQISDMTTGKTTVLPHEMESADYPASVCAPPPFSHVGHCNVLPARGPIHALKDYLKSEYPSMEIHVIPYDWRRSMVDNISHKSSVSFASILKNVVDSIPMSKKVITIAHGYGCQVVANVLNDSSSGETGQRQRHELRVDSMLCVAPSHPNQAVVALQDGEGLLMSGHAHKRGDTCANVWSGQVDFSGAHGLLGMTRRRFRNQRTPNGAWNTSDESEAASTRMQRIQLARSWNSVTELAQSDGRFPNLYNLRNVVCINAHKSKDYIPACHMMGDDEHVLRRNVSVNHMQVVDLVKDALGDVLENL